MSDNIPGLLVSKHSATAYNNLQALFSLPPPQICSIEKSPQNNQTYACKLCTAGTSGRVLKRQWWKLMSYAIKPVRGMLIIVWFLFVCLALHIFSSPGYLSMANCAVSSERCSSLGEIALSSTWYASSWFEMCFNTVPILTRQLINEGSHHWCTVIAVI